MPVELEKMKVESNKCFDIFKILETFNYKFSKEDMKKKWDIFGSPREVNATVELRKAQIEKLKAKFMDEMKVSQDDFKE